MLYIYKIQFTESQSFYIFSSKMNYYLSIINNNEWIVPNQDCKFNIIPFRGNYVWFLSHLQTERENVLVKFKVLPESVPNRMLIHREKLCVPNYVLINQIRFYMSEEWMSERIIRFSHHFYFYSCSRFLLLLCNLSLSPQLFTFGREFDAGCTIIINRWEGFGEILVSVYYGVSWWL